MAPGPASQLFQREPMMWTIMQCGRTRFGILLIKWTLEQRPPREDAMKLPVTEVSTTTPQHMITDVLPPTRIDAASTGVRFQCKSGLNATKQLNEKVWYEGHAELTTYFSKATMMLEGPPF